MGISSLRALEEFTRLEIKPSEDLILISPYF
jgi:hypothetical protein